MRGFVAQKLLIIAALFGFSISSCAAQAPADAGEHWKWGTIAEVGERKTILDAVETAVKTSDYAKLDSLESAYRDSRTSSGVPKLSLYYQEIIDLLGSAPTAERCSDSFWREYIDKWQAASPRAPAPIIARASMHEHRAWCYRGNGTADTVSADGWQHFHEEISAAVEILKKNKAIASEDSKYYEKLLSLYALLERSQGDFQALLSEAVSRYPYYYGIYEVAFNYALPQWGGSGPATDAIARLAVTKTHERDGTSAYFRVYWHRVICNCVRDLDAMDWPTMRVAMADLARLYPGDWTYLHLIQMSCLRGDAVEARRYFAKLDINTAGSWTQKAWDACRTTIGRPIEPLPKTASP